MVLRTWRYGRGAAERFTMAAMNRQELAELLEMLLCPVCRKSLVIRSEDSLKCNDCKRVYPIRDEIVIMLESYASIEQV